MDGQPSGRACEVKEPSTEVSPPVMFATLPWVRCPFGVGAITQPGRIGFLVPPRSGAALQALPK